MSCLSGAKIRAPVFTPGLVRKGNRLGVGGTSGEAVPGISLSRMLSVRCDGHHKNAWFMRLSLDKLLSPFCQTQGVA